MLEYLISLQVIVIFQFGLGFFGFQIALSFVVLEEAEGSPTKQIHRRRKKGFGQNEELR
jgi:hypothetical protein